LVATCGVALWTQEGESMSGWTLSLTGIGDDIPLVAVSIGDPHQGYAQVTKHPDAHSPAMFHAETSGTVMAEGVLHAGSLTYRMDNCVLTEFTMSDDVENWKLSCTKIAIEYASADSGETAAADYDLSAGREGLHVEPDPD
jgi:hypothetical protein